MTPDSEHLEPDRRLIEKVAWGIHYARGYGSPRKAWAGMDGEDRQELFKEAEGAIEAYEAAALRGETTLTVPASSLTSLEGTTRSLAAQRDSYKARAEAAEAGWKEQHRKTAEAQREKAAAETRLEAVREWAERELPTAPDRQQDELLRTVLSLAAA